MSAQKFTMYARTLNDIAHMMVVPTMFLFIGIIQISSSYL